MLASTTAQQRVGEKTRLDPRRAATSSVATSGTAKFAPDATLPVVLRNTEANPEGLLVGRTYLAGFF